MFYIFIIFILIVDGFQRESLQQDAGPLLKTFRALPKLYLVKSTTYEAPHSPLFCNLSSLRSSYQMLSSALYSHTQSIWWNLLRLSSVSGACTEPTFWGPSVQYRRLTWLITQEDFIEFSSHKSSRTYTLNHCSSLSVRDQLSHHYKTAGKITVLYILIFRFLR
jgi:hypothetical protein